MQSKPLTNWLLLSTVLFAGLIAWPNSHGADEVPVLPQRSEPLPPPDADVSGKPMFPTVDPVAKNWVQFVRVRQPDFQFAWTNDKDHEDAGIETKGGGAYFGVSAMHVLYKATDLGLVPPAGSTKPQVLFAPTTRPPNGSCLEIGTAYTGLPGQTSTAFVYVYDFCTSPRAFVSTMPVNADFMKKYAGATVAGRSAYKVSIFTQDKSLNDSTKWLARIFNYKRGTWETIFAEHGYVRADYRGWSIFETWYAAGQCSKSLPVLAAANISYLNAISGNWEPISDNMTQLDNSLHGGGNCFQDDSHGQASYVLSKVSQSGWQVVSTGH
jgi:hypothetical protein